VPETPPLIVTAALESEAFETFQTLRGAHFPAHRNKTPAHVTLFHALPGEEEAGILKTLHHLCGGRRPMRLDVLAPQSLGRGVAYRLASPELSALRRSMADAFAGRLTRQDQAPFRPHITVQNKVEPGEARALLEQLQAGFEPFHILAEGVLVWRYLGGPWSLVDRIVFESSPGGPAVVSPARDSSPEPGPRRCA
jgi:2'-5' RNA ligase